LKLLVPIDGSKPSENVLEYAVKLHSSFISGNSNKEIIILNVIPHFHIPLGFEKQMKSLKTGGPISLTDFINEKNEAIKSEWVLKLSEIKQKI
jgi:hypothetical protein